MTTPNSATQQFLLGLAAANQPVTLSADIDWPWVMAQAPYLYVDGILAVRCARGELAGVPDWVRMDCAKTPTVWNEHMRDWDGIAAAAIAALDESGLPYVVLGYPFEYRTFRPECHMRPATDLDVAVDAPIKQVVEALAPHGFTAGLVRKNGQRQVLTLGEALKRPVHMLHESRLLLHRGRPCLEVYCAPCRALGVPTAWLVEGRVRETCSGLSAWIPGPAREFFSSSWRAGQIVEGGRTPFYIFGCLRNIAQTIPCASADVQDAILEAVGTAWASVADDRWMNGLWRGHWSSARNIQVIWAWLGEAYVELEGLGAEFRGMLDAALPAHCGPFLSDSGGAPNCNLLSTIVSPPPWQEAVFDLHTLQDWVARGYADAPVLHQGGWEVVRDQLPPGLQPEKAITAEQT
jgi:hypothetical protein